MDGAWGVRDMRCGAVYEIVLGMQQARDIGPASGGIHRIQKVVPLALYVDTTGSRCAALGVQLQEWSYLA